VGIEQTIQNIPHPRERERDTRAGGGMMVYWFSAAPVLNYLVNVIPLDGDINQIRTVDQTPDGGGRTHKGVGAGRKVHTEHFPTRMEWQGPVDPATIGDFNQTNLLNVSERAKDLIESLEPSVHQFVPVEYLDKSGAHLDRRYFWVVGNRLDSADHDRTTFVLLGGKMWRPIQDVAQSFPDHLPRGVDPAASSSLLFSREQIGSAQVWRDKFIDGGGPLVSATFVGAVSSSGLTGARFTEAGELV
jgi:hypothetical protein